MKWPKKPPLFRIALAVLLILAALLVAAYWRATRPEALRRQLAAALSVAHNLSIDADSLQFSPLDGLELHGVSMKSTVPLTPAMRRSDAEVVHIGTMRIRHNRWSLLTGRFVPLEISARNASILLVRDQATGRTNWLDATQAGGAGRMDLADLPPITLRNADVQIISIENGHRRVLRRAMFDADVTREDGEYVLRTGYSGSPREPLARARWDPATKRIHGYLDWTNLDIALGLAPPEYSVLEKDIGLRGRVRFLDVVVRGDRIETGTMEFTDVSCAPPLADAGANLEPQDRYLQITGASGAARIEHDTLKLTANAHANGAPASARLTASFDRSRSTLAAFDARLATEPVELPRFDHPKHAAFIAGLPPAVRNFFEDYEPRAHARLGLHIVRTEPDGPTVFEGRTEFVDGSCRYFRFPYRFDGVHGVIDFSPRGILLQNLEGRHGSAAAVLNGRLDESTGWTAFELAIDARHVPLDRELFDALPPEHRRLWTETSPIGMCNLHVAITRAAGSAQTGPLEPHIRIDGELLVGSVALGQHGRLTHADGRITIESGLTTIHELSGRLGDADMQLAGTIESFPDRAPDIRLDVRGANLALRQTTNAAGALTFTFDGHGDVWGQVNNTPAEHPDSYVVNVRDGKVLLGPTAPVWDQARGWVAQRAGRLHLDSFSARHGNAWMTAVGDLPLTADAGPIALEIQAGDLPMESLSKYALPGDWATVCRKLGLAGPGRFSLRLGPGDTDASPTVSEIRLESERIVPEPLPIPFRNARATLSIVGNEARLQQALAEHGEFGCVRMSGKIGWEPEPSSDRPTLETPASLGAPDAGPGSIRETGLARADARLPNTTTADRRVWSDLKLDASSLDLNRELIAALPETLRKLLTRLSASGQITLAVDHLAYDSTGAETWVFQGHTSIEKGRLDVGLPFRNCRGSLTGQARIPRQGHPTIDAAFSIASGTLAARPIEGWHGRLAQAAGEPMIHVRDLRGRICGGEMVGSAEADLTDSTYEVSATFHDLNFEQFLGRPLARTRSEYEGRLDGHLFFRGRLDDPRHRTGGGSMRVRGASLVRTPLLRLVAESRSNQGPMSEEINSADVRFALDGDVVHLSAVDIQTRDLRLVGEGRWNIHDDTVEITLVGANPRNWPRIAILSDLLEGAGRDLVQYRLTGPASSPRVAVEPLHTLTDPLRRLLAGASR